MRPFLSFVLLACCGPADRAISYPPPVGASLEFVSSTKGSLLALRGEYVLLGSPDGLDLQFGGVRGGDRVSIPLAVSSVSHFDLKASYTVEGATRFGSYDTTSSPSLSSGFLRTATVSLGGDAEGLRLQANGTNAVPENLSFEIVGHGAVELRCSDGANSLPAETWSEHAYCQPLSTFLY